MIPKEDFTDVTLVINYAYWFTWGGGGDNLGWYGGGQGGGQWDGQGARHDMGEEMDTYLT